MLKNSYQVIGVMSGTSLDGIDLAQVLLEFNDGTWQYKLMTLDTIAYPEHWRQQLSLAMKATPRELKLLNEAYTLYLAEVINSFISRHNIQDLDAVCSHGHTVLHRPDQGVTLQIGNNSVLARIINQRVVCDFRAADVALGGQGAPLVPIGDRELFGEYNYCINLGGFANISTESPNGRIAYDICPVNVLFNKYANALGQPYDEGGEFARSGEIILPLLSDLNDLPFYKLGAPKSLGMEWVLKEVMPIVEPYKANPRDVLRTLVEHIAMQIANNVTTTSKVLLTGGGAFNVFLLEQIVFHKAANYMLPSKDLINYKEALIFALLGVLKLRDEPNCLASVTGAKHDHSSGNIFLP